MTRFAWFVVVLAACKKEPPRHEGPLRISLGDCADAAVWISGPRPVPPDTRVATGNQKPTAKPKAGGDDAFDTLLGDDTGDLGIRPNTGGTGWGTIGTGRYGTIGRGGFGGGGGRTASVPTVRVGQPNAQGDLDKAIIRRYIKRNIPKIQYCYEKELLAKPAITGTTAVQFFIKPDGTVASSTGAGFDPNVDACVAGVIKGIEFPKPKGGGGVQVNYPFTFHPAGGSPTTVAPTRRTTIADDADTGRVLPSKPTEVKPYTPYTAGDANPFKAPLLPALEECLRGNDKAYGVATFKPGTTTVQGLSEEAATCVGELAVKLPAAKTCSIAFGTMPVAELPSVEVTADAIKFEGVQVADPRNLGDLKFKVPGLFERVEIAVKRDRAVTSPVSIVGPWIVRAPDATPIEVISKVTTTIRAAEGDYVFAAVDGPAWRTVPAVSLPIVPVPLGTGGQWASGSLTGSGDSELVQLSVLVQQGEIWVGLSRVNEFIPIKGLDWAKLESTLVEQRHTAFFADRYDLEVAGEGVTYGDVIKAIEIARKVGFAEVRFSDPEALSARPTL